MGEGLGDLDDATTLVLTRQSLETMGDAINTLSLMYAMMRARADTIERRLHAAQTFCVYAVDNVDARLVPHMHAGTRVGELRAAIAADRGVPPEHVRLAAADDARTLGECGIGAGTTVHFAVGCLLGGRPT